MKKWIALTLMLCLALACVPALAVTPGEVVGEWFLQYRVDSDLPFVMQGDYRLTINRDGTANLVMGGVERTVNWSIDSDGDVRLEGDDIDTYLRMEEGLLRASMKDLSVEDSRQFDFYFGREAVKVTLPEPATATQEDDFYGTWTAESFLIDGGVADYSDQNIVAVIEFAQITLSMGDDPVVVLTDYVDGKLTFSGKAAGLSYGDEKYIVELTSDPDMARAYLEGLEDQGVVYFRRADGAAMDLTPAEEAVEEAAEGEEEAADEGVVVLP